MRIKDLGRPVHINLPGVVHRYAAGHRIELVLASTDAAYTGSRIVNVISLHLDKRIPSRLTVPIVSAANQTPVSAPTVASASVRAGQVNGLGIQAAGAADVAPLPDTATAPAAPAALVAAALTWFGLAVRRRRSPASR